MKFMRGSTMIYAGVGLLTKIMGHYSPEFTLKVYGHIFEDQRKKRWGSLNGGSTSGAKPGERTERRC